MQTICNILDVAAYVVVGVVGVWTFYQILLALRRDA